MVLARAYKSEDDGAEVVRRNRMLPRWVVPTSSELIGRV